MIYAIEILDRKFIKVGFSKSDDVRIRMSELQTGCPFEMRPIFTVPGTLLQEQSIHGALNVAFGRIRIPMPPNEWYPGRNPFFESFLEHLRLGANMGIAFAEGYNPAVRQPGGKPHKLSVVPNTSWPARPGKREYRQ